MTKMSVRKLATRMGKPAAGGLLKSQSERTKVVQRAAKPRQSDVGKARVEAVMQAAAQSGLLTRKSSRIAGRVSPALVKQAKRQSGIETDTDLIEFALATVALEDRFAKTFKKSRGKVAPELKLGF